MNRLKLVTALLASICATTAFAQNHGKAEVSGAVSHDTLASLRDVVVRPGEFRTLRHRGQSLGGLAVFRQHHTVSAVRSGVADLGCNGRVEPLCVLVRQYGVPGLPEDRCMA